MVQETFVGRMFLFGFKIQTSQLLKRGQKLSDGKKHLSTLTLSTLVSSPAPQTSNGILPIGFSQANSSSSQYSGSQASSLPRLIAFQTIEPDTNTELCGSNIPVISLFKHRLANLINGNKSCQGYAPNKSIAPSQDKSSVSMYLQNSTIMGSGNSSGRVSIAPSFAQPSLMLTCEESQLISESQSQGMSDTPKSGKDWKLGISQERPSLPNTISEHSTLSNDCTDLSIEVFRNRPSLEIGSDNFLSLQGINFNESLNFNSGPSQSQRDSLLYTQSQHLSQPYPGDYSINTPPKTFNHRDRTQITDEPHIPDVPDLTQDPDLTLDPDLTQDPDLDITQNLEISYDPSRTENNNLQQSGEEIPCAEQNCRITPKHSTAQTEGDCHAPTTSCDSFDASSDSILLLACQNEGQPNVNVPEDGLSDSTYSDSDSELLLVAEMMTSMNVEPETVPESEEIHVVAPESEWPTNAIPDSEEIPLFDSELPYSEKLDSFLNQSSQSKRNREASPISVRKPEPVDSIPDSEEVTIPDSELPYSEKMDSFLEQSSKKQSARQSSAKSIHHIFEQKSEKSQIITDNNPDSEEIPMFDSELPYSEKLDTFLENEFDVSMEVERCEHESREVAGVASRTLETGNNVIQDSQELELVLEEGSTVLKSQKEISSNPVSDLSIKETYDLQLVLQDSGDKPMSTNRLAVTNEASVSSPDGLSDIEVKSTRDLELLLDGTMSTQSDSPQYQTRTNVVPDSEDIDNPIIDGNLNFASNCSARLLDKSKADSHIIPDDSLDQYSEDLFSGSEMESHIYPSEAKTGRSLTSGDIPSIAKPCDKEMDCEINNEEVEHKPVRRKSVHFPEKIKLIEDIRAIDYKMQTTPLVSDRTVKPKSCIRAALNSIPDLPFSPVLLDQGSKNNSFNLSQNLLFTPSPEIIMSAIRSNSDNSYQSTPLQTSSEHEESTVRKLSGIFTYEEDSESFIPPTCAKTKTNIVRVIRESENKENVIPFEVYDQSMSQELFSSNSLDLFPPSQCTEGLTHEENLSSGPRLPYQTDKKMYSNYHLTPKSISRLHRPKINQSCDVFHDKNCDNTCDIEMFSGNSEELFSSDSITT